MRSLLLVSHMPGRLHEAPADALVVTHTHQTQQRTTVDLRDWIIASRAAAEGSPPARIYGYVSGFGKDLVGIELNELMPMRPDGILLADTIGGQDLSRLGAMLAVHEAEHGFEDGSTRIIATVSSARGVLAMGSLAGVSRRLAGIAWDAEALRADLGAQAIFEAAGTYADPYRTARAMTLFAAAAAKVRAIDTAWVGINGLAEQCRTAHRDGFSAKLALDAAQVPIINAAFAPRPR